MKKRAVNHHKAHKSPQWPPGAPSPCAVVQWREFRSGPVASGAFHANDATARRRSRGRDLPSPWEPPSLSLRRYVRTSSPRVWLRRQGAEAGGAPVPTGRHGLSIRSAEGPGWAEESVGQYPGERLNGVSLCRDHALRYRVRRNRQMEHLTQVAASLRGGIRRDAAITPREREAAKDLVMTTLSDKMLV